MVATNPTSRATIATAMPRRRPLEHNQTKSGSRPTATRVAIPIKIKTRRLEHDGGERRREERANGGVEPIRKGERAGRGLPGTRRGCSSSASVEGVR
jgi:hypothetical protein